MAPRRSKAHIPVHDGPVVSEDGLSLPEYVRVCNCADCRRLMVSRTSVETQVWWHGLPEEDQRKLPRVAGRIMGRPYCMTCISTKYAPQKPKPYYAINGGHGRRGYNNNPVLDNVTRAMEDG